MTDNVNFQTDAPATPAKTTVVAADVIEGVAYQRVKIVTGEDGKVDGDITNKNPVQTMDVVVLTMLQEIATTLKKIEYHLMLATDANLNDQDVGE